MVAGTVPRPGIAKAKRRGCLSTTFLACQISAFVAILLLCSCCEGVDLAHHIHPRPGNRKASAVVPTELLLIAHKLQRVPLKALFCKGLFSWAKAILIAP